MFEVEAILFDVDGTLVDSTPAVERSWRTLAVEDGLDPDDILAVSHGRRSEDTIADFWPHPARQDAVTRLAALELADLDSVVALPRASALLRSLPPQRWAAVTSGSRELMTARLLAAGLPVPAVLVTGDDVQRGKPDPQGYLLAATQLGVDPATCLVVEDAPPGVGAGLASGAAVLGVATSHAPDLLRDAHAVIHDLTGLTVDVTPGGSLAVRLVPLSE